MQTRIHHEGTYLTFYFEKEGEGPSLPLRMSGEYATMGWDTPNYWAIDATGQAWSDSGGHGGGLKRCTLEEMLRDMEPDATYLAEEIRQSMGMKPVMPEWMKTALEMGWTPPPEFDPSRYETAR